MHEARAGDTRAAVCLREDERECAVAVLHAALVDGPICVGAYTVSEVRLGGWGVHTVGGGVPVVEGRVGEDARLVCEGHLRPGAGYQPAAV